MDNTQLVIKNADLREKKIAEFTKACDKLETSLRRDTWGIADIVYKTVSADNFNDAFTNLQDYADCVNYGKSNLSKMSQSVKWVKVCMNNNLPINKSDFTVGQVTELLPLFKRLFTAGNEVVVTDTDINEFINFYNDNGITPDISTKDLRTKVKAYIAAITDKTKSNKSDKQDTTEKNTSETDSKPLNDTSLVNETADVNHIFFRLHEIGKADDEYNITNPQMIMRIKDFLQELFIAFDYITE